MRKFPILATIFALLAIGTMISLGFWQLERKGEKEALLERYGNASSLAAISYPTTVDPDNVPLFRRSSLHCSEVIGWSSGAGINARGESGLAHIAQCKTKAGINAEISVGWSKSPESPIWSGGLVRGIITEGRVQPIKLVAQEEIAGLEILQAPDPANIPNNHFLYAIQWFIFAFFAALIAGLAIRVKMTASNKRPKK